MSELDNKKIIVLYHADEDGIASAYAAWKEYKDNATYIKVQYGNPFPIALESLTDDMEIYILDFSYARQTLLDVHARVKKLVVLDHHKTSEADLKGLEFAKFGHDIAGALMSWYYFQSGTMAPMALQLVNDYDLYRFTFATTKAFIFGLNANPRMYDLEFWDQLCNSTDAINRIITTGEVLLEELDNKKQKFLNSDVKWKIIDFNGFKTAIYNDTEQNSTRNAFAEALYSSRDLEIEIAISYRFFGDGRVIVAFRTNRSYIDVSSFAKELGGGGREKTAAAQLSFEDGISFLQKHIS